MTSPLKGASRSDDILALKVLSIEITKITAIGEPPEDFGKVRKYRNDIEKVLDNAITTTNDVENYAAKINQKMYEIRNVLMRSTIVVQKAIKKTMENIGNTSDRNGPSLEAVNHLSELLSIESSKVSKMSSWGFGITPSESIQKLNIIDETLSLENDKERLKEAITQCQVVIGKIKSNAGYSISDMEHLKGCLNSWENQKKKSYEEELQEQEAEQQRREEMKRQMQEQENKRKRIAEEKHREEEERKKQEIEEAKKRHKEERRQEQEQENKRKRIAEEKHREDEERKKQEIEEAKKKELAAEEKRKRDAYEKKEAERIEKMEQKRKEDERKYRLDPKNWTPIIYYRELDKSSIGQSFHQGVCCTTMSMPESIQKDDIQCLASDEDNDVLPPLENGEKLLSSVVSLNSKKGRIKLEAPMMVFIPHHTVENSSDELVVKTSVNGSDWVRSSVALQPKSQLTDKALVMSGTELQDINTAKIVVVARPRSQDIIIDESGKSHISPDDKNVKVSIPPNAFGKPTKCKLSVKTVPDDVLSVIEMGSDNAQSSSITAGPVVSFECQTPPKKQIKIDLSNSSDEVVDESTIKRQYFKLLKTDDDPWTIDGFELKFNGRNVSIALPASKKRYSIQKIEAPLGTNKDDVLRIANGIYDAIDKTVVRLIVKQKQLTPEQFMVQCLPRERIAERKDELARMGYAYGPDTSREFFLMDGQKLCITFAGNIGLAVEESGQIVLPFYIYMDSAKQEGFLKVRDEYKQKEMKDYAGIVHCLILPSKGTENEASLPGHSPIKIPITLPKKTQRVLAHEEGAASIRFPYYVSVLAVYLSLKLTEADNKIGWFSVLCELESHQKMQTLRNRSKRQKRNATDQELCLAMILNWMKTTNVNEDKLEPIMKALEKSKLPHIAQGCQQLVTYHKETMTDSALLGIAEKVRREPCVFGRTLGISDVMISKCVSENTESPKNQIIAMLKEWRISIMAVEKGMYAFYHLQAVSKM